MSTTVATSLKLPAELKAAIDDNAKKLGMSSHAYMVKTLSDTAERMRLQDRFTRDALAAEQDMLRTGLGHPWADVQQYFAQLAEFRAGRAERPERLVPQKLG